LNVPSADNTRATLVLSWSQEFLTKVNLTHTTYTCQESLKSSNQVGNQMKTPSRRMCPNCSEYALDEATEPKKEIIPEDGIASFWICLSCGMTEMEWAELTI
jgi:uncharacterized protein with PIN domain